MEHWNTSNVKDFRNTKNGCDWCIHDFVFSRLQYFHKSLQCVSVQTLVCVCVLITAGQTQLGLVSEVCMQSHSIETAETVVVASALVQTYFWSCSGDWAQFNKWQTPALEKKPPKRAHPPTSCGCDMNDSVKRLERRRNRLRRRSANICGVV